MATNKITIASIGKKRGSGLQYKILNNFILWNWRNQNPSEFRQKMRSVTL
jgi:hypothetical protein